MQDRSCRRVGGCLCKKNQLMSSSSSHQIRFYWWDSLGLHPEECWMKCGIFSTKWINLIGTGSTYIRANMSCIDKIEQHFQTWMISPFMSFRTFPNAIFSTSRLSNWVLRGDSACCVLGVSSEKTTSQPTLKEVEIDSFGHWGIGTPNLQNFEIYGAMHRKNCCVYDVYDVCQTPYK